MAAFALFLVRCLTARRPLVDLRGWGRIAREADLVGALLLAAALSGVILAFATADPKIQVFSDQGLWYLLGGAVAAVAFGWHLRRAEAPLIPTGALRRTPAWGSLLVSFFVGAALIAALIDIPIFARTTIYADSQLMAALVLVRFLVALPVGAVVGGYLTRTLPAGVVTAAGMVLAAVGFVWMSSWHLETLEHATATLPLVICGFGFGLALAPVNAAVLASTDDDVHGLATASVVVARMVGMLVGISALTTIGLRRYYAEQADMPSVREVCEGKSRCDGFTLLLKEAGIAQEHTVFLGAAVCAAVAGVLALRALPTRTDPRARRSDPAPLRRLRTTSLAPVGDFDDLLAANAEYAAHFTGGDFDGVAHAGVAIVTCMDSRIEPLRMLGLRYGDAKIFRNPGGRVTEAALEALVLGVHLLGVERILVIPHTKLRDDPEHRAGAPGPGRRIRRPGCVVAALPRHRRPARHPGGGRGSGPQPPPRPRERGGRWLRLRRRHRAAGPEVLNRGH